MLCGKWETYPREFAKCRRCRKAKYCGKECQSTAWSEGHRFWCSAKDVDDDNATSGAAAANATSSSAAAAAAAAANTSAGAGAQPANAATAATAATANGIPIRDQGGEVPVAVNAATGTGNTPTRAERSERRAQREQRERARDRARASAAAGTAATYPHNATATTTTTTAGDTGTIRGYPRASTTTTATMRSPVMPASASPFTRMESSAQEPVMPSSANPFASAGPSGSQSTAAVTTATAAASSTNSSKPTPTTGVQLNSTGNIPRAENLTRDRTVQPSLAQQQAQRHAQTMRSRPTIRPLQTQTHNQPISNSSSPVSAGSNNGNMVGGGGNSAVEGFVPFHLQTHVQHSSAAGVSPGSSRSSPSPITGIGMAMSGMSVGDDGVHGVQSPIGPGGQGPLSPGERRRRAETIPVPGSAGTRRGGRESPSQARPAGAGAGYAYTAPHTSTSLYPHRAGQHHHAHTHYQPYPTHPASHLSVRVPSPHSGQSSPHQQQASAPFIPPASMLSPSPTQDFPMGSASSSRRLGIGGSASDDDDMVLG